MSHPDLFYPPPRHQGEEGLVNATLRRTDHEPEVRYPSGGTAHYLATHASTGGQFGLYRREMAAEPGGPEPHFHRTISESFYVLTGSVRLYDGRAWIEANAGASSSCPRAGSTRSATSPGHRRPC